jgi:glutathione S-transferase
MITLYHCANARSFRPLWMLEELGIPYRLMMLPFPPRARAPDYLGINPLGTIPLLIDGETSMTESAAICQYLATRYGPSPLAVSPDQPAYGRFLNFLHFGEATLTFPQTLVLRYGRLEPEERRLPQVVEDYARWFMARLRAVTAAMEAGDWICAGRFTAADVSVGYALLFAERLDLAGRFSPGVAGYWRRLQARDGFQRAVAAQARASAEQGLGGETSV